MKNSVEGWRAFTNPRYFVDYGRQKGWERIKLDNDNELSDEMLEQFTLISTNEPFPFDQQARCRVNCRSVVKPVVRENPLTKPFINP